jgi:hypothetical protein
MSAGGVYYNPGPMFQPSNWYGSGAPWPAGYTPPNQAPRGSAYSAYFQRPNWASPDFFGGTDPLTRGALDAPENYLVGYGQIAGRVAPNPSSNLSRYILSQAGRLRNSYDYASLSDPGLSWSQYAGQHVPDLEREFRYLSPEQRGERSLFPVQGGRFLG